ncbi:hypothetical protein O0L34_g11757 [Tuta absoluta]|nr:hypothetical protein O0L34_g11757 [Tuta absoluta]
MDTGPTIPPIELFTRFSLVSTAPHSPLALAPHRHYKPNELYKVFLVMFVGEISCWVFNNINRDVALRMEDIESLESEFEGEVMIQERINLIFPGTKWCGPGNVADNFDDLGPAKETDKCCRAHDNCPEVIEPGQTWRNLTNEAFYSRLSCACDYEFRDCLHKVNSRTSTIIGKMYFNTIGTQCFREDYPAVGCNRRGGWLNSKCLDYEYDSNGKKRYQWFDVPNY